MVKPTYIIILELFLNITLCRKTPMELDLELLIFMLFLIQFPTTMKHANMATIFTILRI